MKRLHNYYYSVVDVYEIGDKLEEREDDMCLSVTIITVNISAINNNRIIHKFVSVDDGSVGCVADSVG